LAIGLLLSSSVEVYATDNPAGTTLTSTLTGTSPLTNEGTITLIGYGISNGNDGATIINSGTISVNGANNHGISSFASLSNITNSGLISVSGVGALGIIIWDNNNGGIITNTETGVISVSGWTGIGLSNNNITVNNFGSITGNSGIIAFNSSSTVNNFGRVVGTDGNAIYFQGVNNTLNLYKGSVIVGNIHGNTGSSLNINLGSAASYAYSTTGTWTIADLDNRPMVTGSAYAAGIGAQETAAEMLYQRTSVVTSALDRRLRSYASNEIDNQPYWLDVYYSDVTRNSGGNYSTQTAFSNYNYGIIAGFKLPAQFTPLELVVNVEQSNSNIDGGNQKIDSSSIMAGLLAPNLTDVLGARLSAKALVGYADHNGDRKVMTNSLLYDGSRQIKSDYNSTYAVLGTALTKLYSINSRLTADVVLGLDLNVQHTESYKETDYFAWDSRTLTQLQSRVQTGLDYKLWGDKGSVFARVGAEHRDLIGGATQDYAINGTNVSFNTNNKNDTYLTAQVGIKAQLEKRIQLFGILNTLHSSDSVNSVSGNIGLRADF
jgi:hypothetical protein